VSISTTRETPSALGLPGHDDVAARGVAAWVGAAGAGGAATGGATCAAVAGEFCAGTAGALGAPAAVGTTGLLSVTVLLGAVGTFGVTGAVGAVTRAVDAALGAAGAAFGATSASAEGLIGAVAAGAACRSSKGVTTARAAPPVVAWAAAGKATGTERLCDRMPPNTARHMTMASAPIIAASRMAKPPNLESSRHRWRQYHVDVCWQCELRPRFQDLELLGLVLYTVRLSPI
jgi:hypothetical protein